MAKANKDNQGNESTVVHIDSVTETHELSGKMIVSSPIIFNSAAGQNTSLLLDLELTRLPQHSVMPTVTFQGFVISGNISVINVAVKLIGNAMDQTNLTVTGGNLNVQNTSLSGSHVTFWSRMYNEKVKDKDDSLIEIKGSDMDQTNINIFADSNTKIALKSSTLRQSGLFIHVEKHKQNANVETNSGTKVTKQDKYGRHRRSALGGDTAGKLDDPGSTANVLLHNLHMSGDSKGSKQAQVHVESNTDFDIVIRKSSFVNGSRGLYLLQSKGVTNIYIEHTLFAEQIVDGSGGGVKINNRQGDIIIKLSYSKFHRNVAKRKITTENTSKGKGGGIFIQSNPQGAIINEIHNCEFIDNIASDSGGSLYVTSYVTSFLSHNLISNKNSMPTEMIYLKGTTYLVDSSILSMETHNSSFMLQFEGLRNNDFLFIQNVTISCPKGTSFSTDPANPYKFGHKVLFRTIYLKCSVCPNGFFKLNQSDYVFDAENIQQHSSKKQCQSCPSHANCSHGKIKIEKHYWANQLENGISTSLCPKGYCCQDKYCPLKNTCVNKRYGTLCGMCLQNYSMSIFSQSCVKDSKCIFPEITWVWISVLGYIIIVVLMLLFLPAIFTSFVNPPSCCCGENSKENTIQREKKKEKRNAISYTMVLILFDFYQTLWILQNVAYPKKDRNENTALTLNSDILHYVINILALDIFDIDLHQCFLPSLTPFTKSLVQLVIYNSIVLVFVMFYLFTWCTRYCQTSTETDRKCVHAQFIRSFVLLCLVVYTLYTHILLSLIHCVRYEPDNEYVLFIDGNILCFQDWQYASLAFIGIHIVPLFIIQSIIPRLLHNNQIKPWEVILGYTLPIIYLVRLAFIPKQNPLKDEEYENNQNLGQEEESTVLQACLQVLWIPYRTSLTHRISWLGVILVRKLAIITVATLIINQLIVSLSLFLILISFLLLQFMCLPYRYRFLNFIESCSILISTITAFAFFIEQFIDHSIAVSNFQLVMEWTSICATVLCTICFIIVIICGIMFACCNMCVRKFYKARTYDISKDHEHILTISQV